MNLRRVKKSTLKLGIEMNIAEIIKEILYLFQHSTGLRPTESHVSLAVYGLQQGIHPLEIKNALIMMAHEDSRKYHPNPNLRSCDW